MTNLDVKEELHGYLRGARETLVWKLDGLSEYDIRRPLTPTGTNLLGLVKHSTATTPRLLRRGVRTIQRRVTRSGSRALQGRPPSSGRPPTSPDTTSSTAIEAPGTSPTRPSASSVGCGRHVWWWGDATVTLHQRPGACHCRHTASRRPR